MIKTETERMIMVIEYDIVNKRIEFPKSNKKIDLLKLKKSPGIYFFEKTNMNNKIAHISLINSNDGLEISYGIDNTKCRNKKYMKEAINAFISWLFSETDEKEINARICNNDVSQHILESVGFFKNGNSKDGSLWFTLNKDSIIN